MIPFIVGGLVIAAVGVYLDDAEKKSKKKHAKKLKKKHKVYTQQLQKQQRSNNRQKQHLLFAQIKGEQSKLKKERGRLMGILHSLDVRSSVHKKLVQEIQQISLLIEKKQNDANRVKEYA